MSAVQGLATGRLRPPLAAAPDGLGLVQELVNTSLRVPRADGRLADLLADPASAGAWLSRALAQWAGATGQPVPRISLQPGDLAPLREVREAIRVLATRADGGADRGADGGADGGEAVTGTLADTRLALSLEPGGRVVYAPAAAGWLGVAALAAAEILLAQQRGQWARFKACPLPPCGVAFYDQSRNVSRVWHDVRTCGNQANLRAHRARRKHAGGSAAQRPGTGLT